MKTLEFFRLMQLSSVKPNRVSLSSALLACGRLGARRGGGCFHCLAIKTRFEHDVLVANAVVDMYAKCGSLELASLMFDHFDGKDVVNMYEAILGRAGKLQEAEEFIKQMPMEPEASIWVNRCGESEEANGREKSEQGSRH
ncbi:hypothetical protein B296_00039618 [Ensete ventricosum]|uniref:Pentacotripeptide-repeat region of PRORP domain-containing protein n=1 Tax=Ensete ventricosum TaxID=4639 RepID=A0A426X701_ENSVE|nr:hypothetical protein B296_00039618 [Ensete ventricosum]